MKRKEKGEREEEDEKKKRIKRRIYTERENKHNNMRIWECETYYGIASSINIQVSTVVARQAETKPIRGKIRFSVLDIQRALHMTFIIQ